MDSLTKAAMETGVKDSARFLFFLSEGVLAREYVQFEGRAALDAGKQVLLIHQADARTRSSTLRTSPHMARSR